MRQFITTERIKGGRRVSNPQPQAPQARALPLSYAHQITVKLYFKSRFFAIKRLLRYNLTYAKQKMGFHKQTSAKQNRLRA